MAPWIPDYLVTVKNNTNVFGTHIQSTNIDDEETIKPQITFTNYGWFHPNKTQGLMYGRSLVMRGLVDAIVDNKR